MNTATTPRFIVEHNPYEKEYQIRDSSRGPEFLEITEVAALLNKFAHPPLSAGEHYAGLVLHDDGTPSRKAGSDA